MLFQGFREADENVVLQIYVDPLNLVLECHRRKSNELTSIEDSYPYETLFHTLPVEKESTQYANRDDLYEYYKSIWLNFKEANGNSVDLRGIEESEPKCKEAFDAEFEYLLETLKKQAISEAEEQAKTEDSPLEETVHEEITIPQLEKARDLIKKFGFDTEFILGFFEGFDCDPDDYDEEELAEFDIDDVRETIAEAVIPTIGARITPEDKNTPLGTSKVGGNPHLPKDFEWPENCYFNAQYNCKEIYEYDVTGTFPKTGILYLFFNPKYNDDIDEYEAVLHYFTGDESELEEREWPEKEWGEESFQYYYDEAKTDGSVLEFSGALGFDFSINDEVDEEMPDALLDALNQLGIPNKESGIVGGSFINSRPCVEQSEDCDCDYGYWPGGLMLYDTSFGDGWIHYWISRDAFTDTPFRDGICTYSGT